LAWPCAVAGAVASAVADAPAPVDGVVVAVVVVPAVLVPVEVFVPGVAGASVAIVKAAFVVAVGSLGAACTVTVAVSVTGWSVVFADAASDGAWPVAAVAVPAPVLPEVTGVASAVVVEALAAMPAAAIASGCELLLVGVGVITGTAVMGTTATIRVCVAAAVVSACVEVV
jgi:hypothetical protein